MQEFKLMFSSVGENAGMENLLRLYSVAFDWKQLIFDFPHSYNLKAFRELYFKCLPFLQHTLWPDADDFPDVPRTMVLTPKIIETQYKVLLR